MESLWELTVVMDFLEMKGSSTIILLSFPSVVHITCSSFACPVITVRILFFICAPVFFISHKALELKLLVKFCKRHSLPYSFPATSLLNNMCQKSSNFSLAAIQIIYEIVPNVAIFSTEVWEFRNCFQEAKIIGVHFIFIKRRKKFFGVFRLFVFCLIFGLFSLCFSIFF